MAVTSLESSADFDSQRGDSPPLQRGLRWEYGLFDIVPKWEFEPDIEVVRRVGLTHLPAHISYTVSKFAEGAFNKLYLFSPSRDQGKERAEGSAVDYIMRVSLPVDPYFKTASEVATLRFLAQHTSIPVPEVVAYDASSKNDLQFEWILMTRLPGVPLKEVWSALSWNQKVDLVAKLSSYIRELHTPRCSQGGSLYFTEEQRPRPHLKAQASEEADSVPIEDFPGFAIGPMVTLPFFYGDRIKVRSDRGPFSDSRQMVTSLLNLQISSTINRKETLAASIQSGESEYDSEDLEDLDEMIAGSKILLSLVDQFFGETGDEDLVLHHDDISDNNILVDPDTFQITGIVDWECSSLQPLWQAARPPQLLDGSEVNAADLRRNFGVEIPTDPSMQPPTLPDLSGVDKDTDFHEELRDNLEKMLLRRVFENTKPPDGLPQKLRRVFMNKVLQLDSEITFRMALRWSESVRDGGNPEPQRDENQLYFWPEQ